MGKWMLEVSESGGLVVEGNGCVLKGIRGVTIWGGITERTPVKPGQYNQTKCKLSRDINKCRDTRRVNRQGGVKMWKHLKSGGRERR